MAIPRDKLREAYLYTFDAFATDRSEIADVLGIDKSGASEALRRLEDARLVCSIDVNDEAQGRSRRGQYKELTWQCWQTHDEATREEAEATFDKAFPV